MADYHTTYKGPEGETTQWDDIQVKLGNKAAPEPKHKPEPFAPEQAIVRDEAWLDGKEEEELSDLEDDFEDDRYLEAIRFILDPMICRQRRLDELRNAASKPQFGSLDFIRGADFAQKVTASSSDVWVTVLLFKDDHEGSQLLRDIFEQLAVRYPHNSFVKIISTDCIPNYPDANLPTVLIYHDRKCVKTIAGLTIWGDKRASPEQAALVLNQIGPICRHKGEEDESMGANEREVKGLVRRMVLQRLQQDDLDESDSFDSE